MKDEIKNLEKTIKEKDKNYYRKIVIILKRNLNN